MKITEIAKIVLNVTDTTDFPLKNMLNKLNQFDKKSDFVEKIVKDLGINNFKILYNTTYVDKNYEITSLLDLSEVHESQFNILFDGENIKEPINELIANNLAKKRQALEDYQEKIFEQADNFEVIESAYKKLPKALFDFSKKSFPKTIEIFGQVHTIPVPDKSILNLPTPEIFELELSGCSTISKITLDENAKFFVEIDCKVKNSISRVHKKCIASKDVLIKILNEIEVNRNSFGRYKLEYDGKDYILVDFSLIQLELDLVVL